MICREGEGWRLAWDGDRQPFSVLIGGEGWAAELSDTEAVALREAVADLVAQHTALVDQLMAEEAISLELERGVWWLAIDGNRQAWDLQVVLTPAAGQRAIEGRWSDPASRAFSQALQQLHGQP
ncbi:MAG: DUF1818 family protein [Vulcanococcus sp.]